MGTRKKEGKTKFGTLVLVKVQVEFKVDSLYFMI